MMTDNERAAMNRLKYEDALNLLHEYGNGQPWVAHCLAVSRFAQFCGDVFGQERRIDIEFLRTAALLHDIGRYETHDPILHGVAGYRLLSSLGYTREAFVCASHILYGLASSDAIKYGLPRQDFIPSSFEERLVPLIDFLIEFDRPTRLAQRFASLRERAEKGFFLENLACAERIAEDFMGYINREFQVSMEEMASRAI
jgi:uncharacterized protein